MKKIEKHRLIKVTNQRYREHYHIQTPAGWLNDPNGLCYYKGYYHVFYQFNPYSSQWGPMHWGHVRSKDMIHWEQLPVALIPGDPEDSGGCFSGSAIVKDGRLYLIYTGHHYYDDGNQDHFWENQNIAYSDDGIHFTKYSGNPVIEAPKDNEQDFRDPMIWKHDDLFFLVLGSREKVTNLGRLLLYKSKDLFNWDYQGPIAKSTSQDDQGYMWECPDLFRLNGQDVLVCSPQGIQPHYHKFLNKDQVAYAIGQLDYQKKTFVHSSFDLVDYGHNFYATRSFLTTDGRRIQFGWFSSFDNPMPEQADGWAGALTLPRELVMQNNQLGAIPARETRSLRIANTLHASKIIHSKQKLDVPDPQHTEWDLTFILNQPNQQIQWQLANEKSSLLTFGYDRANGEITVHQHGQKDDRYAQVGKLDQLRLQIFVDTSAIEIFVNDGLASFAERYYTDQQTVTTSLIANTLTTVQIQAYTLNLKG